MPPILAIKNGSLSFASHNIFQDVDCTINTNDKICLVGRNGEGKSTLMKVLQGHYLLDSGEIWTFPGSKIAYLEQAPAALPITVEELLKQNIPHYEESKRYLMDMMLGNLVLEAGSLLSDLSGGQLRKAYLAAILLQEADVLLLDEPTNHLDISTILWLQKYLQEYRKAVVVISHDRAFLEAISDKTFWLYNGKLKVHHRGFLYYDEWSLSIIEEEQKYLDRLSRQLDADQDWLHGGVTARRKRNQKRLARLYENRSRLRAGKAMLKRLTGSVQLDPLTPLQASKMVAEFFDVSFSYSGHKPLINHFSYRLSKGEKIGIVGNNGSGKSTMLKLLVGDLEPTSGNIKRGKTVDFSYFAQDRTKVDMDDTLARVLSPNGSDYLQVGSEVLHVAAYLKRFLFDPKQAQQKVSTLSGGQIHRLLLAKALAQPSGVLILDEPTNDLDMDTLEMLEQMLDDYSGTLILVSHDRDFLHKVVEKTLVFTSEGIEEFLGSYQEYESFLTSRPIKVKSNKSKELKLTRDQPSNKSDKISYKKQWELENLPKQIALLEEQMSVLYSNMNGITDHVELAKLSAEYQTYEKQINDLYARLFALE